MSLRRTRLVLGGLALGACAVSGCSGVEPLGTGGIALSWDVGPSGCDAAGVQAVEARVNGPHAIVERFACTAAGATFDDLAPGTYRLELVGFDAEGVPAYVGDPVKTEVVADEVRAVEPIRLLAAPARLDIEWAFENGRVCGANGVAWVTVAAFDEFDYEVATGQFPCDQGSGSILDLRAGEYLIEATGHDDSSPRWRGQTRVRLGRADEVVVDVRLRPTDAPDPAPAR